MENFDELFKKFLFKQDSSCFDYLNKDFILEKKTKRYNVRLAIQKILTQNCDKCIFNKEWDCTTEGVTIVETINGSSCNKFTTTEGPIYVEPVKPGGPEKRLWKRFYNRFFIK